MGRFEKGDGYLDGMRRSSRQTVMGRFEKGTVAVPMIRYPEGA
jgi:hypothetical protein